jgi:hypothetical protein
LYDIGAVIGGVKEATGPMVAVIGPPIDVNGAATVPIGAPPKVLEKLRDIAGRICR